MAYGNRYPGSGTVDPWRRLPEGGEAVRRSKKKGPSLGFNERQKANIAKARAEQGDAAANELVRRYRKRLMRRLRKG